MPDQVFDGTVAVVAAPNIPVFERRMIFLDGPNCRIAVDGDISAGGVRLKGGIAADNIFVATGGQIELWNANKQPTVWLNGAGGNCQVGGNGFHGAMTLKDNAGHDTVAFHADGGQIKAGQIEVGTIDAQVYQISEDETVTVIIDSGRLRLFPPNGGPSHVELNANDPDEDNLGGGLIDITDNAGHRTIRLNGNAGTVEAKDITLVQADCAEDFDLALGESAEPGSVMVIEHEGALKESCDAYDRRVAGVVSGAGDYRTGITLDRQPLNCVGRMPIALTGKAYCKVDANYSPIEVGDLLVTSATRAHAMRANDPVRAFGAVIGKALRRLETGRGLIPILVSLQ